MIAYLSMILLSMYFEGSFKNYVDKRGRVGGSSNVSFTKSYLSKAVPIDGQKSQKIINIVLE